MFTPPPSPLPPRTVVSEEPSLPPSDEEDELEEDSSELESVPHPTGVDPPTSALERPPRFGRSAASPLSPTAPLSAWQSLKKASSRRLIIPLLAVLLVIVAVTSRFAPTRRAAEIWQAAPSPPHVQPMSSASSQQRHQSWTRHIRKPFSNRRRTSVSLAASPSPSSVLSIITTNGTSPSIPDPPYAVPTPFPQPFDTTFSYNFSTSSCQSWLSSSLLSNTTFRKCRPFSLLLPASNAFFASETNLTALTAIIGGTCATTASEADCVQTMTWFADEIQRDTVCGKDLSDRNAIVLEALNGFLNYQFMRQAGCLVNQRTNSYCFVDAVSAYPPSDIYYYNLPLGTPLPNSTTPTCSTCTESLLNIYAQQTVNTSLDISRTYPLAAQKAIAACGSKYATALNVANAGGLSRVIPWFATILAAVGLGVVVTLGGL